MTTLEYMKRQMLKHQANLEREEKRGAPQEVLDNIRKKVSYYEEVVEALRADFGDRTEGDCCAAD